ncbi:hypothetical protein [Hyphomonas sp.]|uniref:hypothetical protein n=1 Tax=Hyphomonas sp. TaxID=87 RepID=UPI003918EE7B
MTRTVPAPSTAPADFALMSPYTAAIRAAAALFSEGAIPKAWPKVAPLAATPLEPVGGLEMAGVETGARVFAA